MTDSAAPSTADIAYKRCIRAIAEIGGCLADLEIVLQQGIREDNAAKRGGIAAGLERAAVLVREEAYGFPDAPKPVVDLKSGEIAENGPA